MISRRGLLGLLGLAPLAPIIAKAAEKLPEPKPKLPSRIPGFNALVSSAPGDHKLYTCCSVNYALISSKGWERF